MRQDPAEPEATFIGATARPIRPTSLAHIDRARLAKTYDGVHGDDRRARRAFSLRMRLPRSKSNGVSSSCTYIGGIALVFTRR